MNLLLKPVSALAVTTVATLAAIAGPATAQIPQDTLSECAVPNRPAMTTYAQMADRPTVPLGLILSGTTMVKLDIDASGRINSASIDQTSGSPLLDNAALAAARGSSFAPEVRDCKPVGGEYLFEVDFPNE